MARRNISKYDETTFGGLRAGFNFRGVYRCARARSSDGAYLLPGRGMGVKFVHMRSEDRSRLNQFLKSHVAAGNIEEDLCAEDGQVTRAREVVPEAAPILSGSSASWEVIFVPRENRAKTVVAALPFVPAQAKEEEHGFDHRQPPQAKATVLEAKPAVEEKIASEEELKRDVTMSQKSTY